MEHATPEISRAPVHLFAPDAAVRGVRAGTIDFLLARTPSAGSVEILAPDGSVVRTFRCESMTCRAGTNRLVWDLSYPGPVVFPGLILRYARAAEGPRSFDTFGLYEVNATTACRPSRVGMRRKATVELEIG